MRVHREFVLCEAENGQLDKGEEQKRNVSDFIHTFIMKCHDERDQSNQLTGAPKCNMKVIEQETDSEINQDK
jgi:hypothetical protein